MLFGVGRRVGYACVVRENFGFIYGRSEQGQLPERSVWAIARDGGGCRGVAGARGVPALRQPFRFRA